MHKYPTKQTSYTAGCYPIPIRFLYGTAAEINFWDVVCFCANEAGGEFDTSTEELAEQTGLSRQVVGQLRREAIKRQQLLEDVSWVSGRRFVLRIPHWDQWTKGIIWKPSGYVRNGWQRIVTPAIPKRVLNLYLQQPRQSIYYLDPSTIAAKCRRKFLHKQQRSIAPLNLADVSQALRLLVRLGLLMPMGEGFRIDWTTFNQPAPLDAPLFDAPDPHQDALFKQIAAADPERAERALELLELGQYDIDAHLADIFRDLAYVREDNYPLLKAKVHRHRNRPAGPNRWRTTWKAFQHELRRRITEVHSSKASGDLARPFACQLALDLDQHKSRVLSVRMVSRVEWPWYMKETVCVSLELKSGSDLLFARTVSPGDAEVRYMLHPDQWPGRMESLALQAQCERPLPGVRVEAWLEAQLRK